MPVVPLVVLTLLRTLFYRRTFRDGAWVTAISRTEHKGMPPAKVSDGIGLKPLVNGLCSAITWDDIEWMGTQTDLPLVLKGVGRAEDALRAADCPPVRGIVCSNHGGRNLDGGALCYGYV